MENNIEDLKASIQIYLTKVLNDVEDGIEHYEDEETNPTYRLQKIVEEIYNQGYITNEDYLQYMTSRSSDIPEISNTVVRSTKSSGFRWLDLEQDNLRFVDSYLSVEPRHDLINDEVGQYNPNRQGREQYSMNADITEALRMTQVTFDMEYPPLSDAPENIMRIL